MIWTFILWFMHVLGHKVPFFMYYHSDHHYQVYMKRSGKWKPTFLLTYIDSYKSTVDAWLTEYIPTIIFCYITGAWWIAILYYLWAVTFNELLEHNDKIDLYPFDTSGKWHLVHHEHPNKNYGLVTPIWDIIFGTAKRHY